MKRLLHISIALLVLAGGVVGTWALIEFSPTPEATKSERPVPVVRVTRVVTETLELRVEAQGTVNPRTEINLVPEVPGRVTWVSPSLWPGGFFEEGVELIRIEARDYQSAVIRAESEVARAEVVLARERAQADLAKSEWDALEPDKSAPPLVLRKPQLNEARALLRAANANLEQARTNLGRTVVKAPFDGRVRRKSVNAGQFVARGVVFAEVYAVDFVEIRLPLPDEELAFLDLPLHGATGVAGHRVDVSARFAGEDHHWEGRVVRVEGEIDTRTRMIHAVARVRDPYNTEGEREGKAPPLAAGMFVSAEIYGKTFENVIAVPRGAMQSATRLLVVEPEAEGMGRLVFREVEVLRRERERVILRAGLTSGELVCVSPVEVVSDGMPVKYVVAEDVDSDVGAGEPTEAPVEQPR